jgi:hypothetical protein
MLATKGGDWPWLMGCNGGHDSNFLSVQFLPFPFLPFSLFVLSLTHLNGGAAGGGVGLELSLN